jgi:hypothetical protein
VLGLACAKKEGEIGEKESKGNGVGSREEPGDVGGSSLGVTQKLASGILGEIASIGRGSTSFSRIPAKGIRCK